jgi:hypothetical protein
MDEKFNLKIYNMFLMYGLAKEDILYVSNKSFCEENIIVDDDSYISSFEERRELETIEIHVAEHCNCSCKNCSMFCALVKQESFPVYSEFEEGLKNLKKYFDHVKTIRIIGGEPLLNPELYKYIDFIGEIFPFSDLRLLSNGILADKMDDRLIESIKRNKVRLFISNYIPVSYKMDKVKAFLDAKEIKNYIITDVITEFQKIYDYRGAADKKVNFDNCHWKNSCATLYGSEMSVCFVPFVIHYLSDSFNLSIEEQKKIDLTSDNLTTGIIRKLMNEPMDVCRYCSMYRISEKWDLANKKEHTLNINDWSV